MDMEEYNDPRQGTETCFKLECNHSFHTKCIMMCLLKSKHACPTCNTEKTPLEKLEIDGLARKLCSEAMRSPEIRPIQKEFIEALKTYTDVLREHKEQSRRAVEQLAIDLKVNENRNYFLTTFEVLRRKIKQHVSELGPKYIAASLVRRRHWEPPLIDSLLLRGHLQNRWRFNRLKYPRFYCPVFNSKKNK
jgi:hypothetical protein